MDNYEKNEILLSRDNKVLQYKGKFNHPELGIIAKVRIYRTNREVGIRFADVTRHPFFSETKKC
jgi:hypothetical protein